ncbi:GNAT family N-acetyltransferase [Micromonospora sp. NPDC049102]|uniref:GNAT family N-acetyltransferase n=1 Tax=Micromonospora sp. NPDC049102 TaxID=3364265 RepID=UPI0037166903
MLIRRETPADVDAIRAVHAAAFAKAGDDGNGDRVPVEATLVDALRADEGWLPAYSLAAVDSDGQVVGHVVATRGRVARLFVVPSARGLALGGALLDRVREWASARGTDLVLEVTSDDAAAVALYERAGWRYTGSSTAPWTAPDGSAVSLRHYTLSL